MLNVEYKKILLVEDDDGIREKTATYFSAVNEVVACATLAEAEEQAEKQKFDIVLLDVVLPDGSGLSLMDKLADTPVIICSDLGEDGSILDGFFSGASDYVVKPASLPVLEARMAMRLLGADEANLSMHGLKLSLTRRTASYGRKPLELTSSEFNILAFLMKNSGKFFTAGEIYENVWKMPYLNTTTIKAHLSNLRKKMLSAGADCANLIITEFGRGYAFLSGEEA